MKIGNVGTLLMSGLVLGGLVAPIVANADSKDTTTSAKIELQKQDTTNPVTPIDPNKPGGETGQTGDLTLDNVTPFDFGKQQVSTNGQWYNEQQANPNVQVSDRRGTAAGWNLQVAASEFKDSTDGHILKGAEIDLPAGAATTDSNNKNGLPNTNAVKLVTDGTGSAANLMDAPKGSGIGTWEDKMNQTDTKMFVPGNSQIGKYTSTLTWTLADAPM